MVRVAGALMLLAGSALAGSRVAGHVIGADGVPIAGAEVRIVALDDNWEPIVRAGAVLPLEPALAKATTGVRGEFAVDGSGIPPGRYAIAFGVPGTPLTLRWRERIELGATDPPEIGLTLPDAVGITGIVIETPGVEHDEGAASPPPEQITARAEGYADGTVPRPTGDAVLIRLARPVLLDVPVRVLTPDGEPLAGAGILAADIHGGVTRGDGRFLVPLPDGRGYVRARKVDAGVTWEGSAVVERPREPGDLTITARSSSNEPGEILVRARGPAGPVAGATVMLDGTASRSGTTGSDGTVLLASLPHGSYEVAVHAEGWDTCRRRSGIHAGESTIVTCEFDAPWWVEGRVVSGDQPVRGASVDARDAANSFTDRTREDGTFRLGPIPGSIETLQVDVAGDGGSRSLGASPGMAPLLFDLESPPVRGRIVGADGPVADLWMAVLEGGGLERYVVTDEAGQFTFFSLAGVERTLVAHSDEGQASITFEAPSGGALDLGDIRLTRATIAGRVEPVDEIDSFELLLATPEGAPMSKASINVAEDGSFTVDAPAGALLFSARAGPSFGPASKEYAPVLGRIESGRPLLLTFPPAATLELSPRPVEGLPPSADAQLIEWNGMARGHPLMWWHLESDGLILEGLPASHVVVEVKSGGRSVLVPADLRHGETTRLEIDLP